ncbi:MAG: hypothetical protein IPG78_09345 [Ignavibacteria bacterium]|nr:hypothetical protein [Ignavibacteria bacterium]
MLKSSLIEIIRTFTKQELSKFEDFVRSPFFNKKENVATLFLEIKKYAPEFTEANLEKEKIWVKVFPGKEYNYGIMKNLIFDLNKLAEHFIIELKFKEDKYKQSDCLINALIDRKLHKLYIIKHNSIDKKPDLNYLNKNNLELTGYLNLMIEIYTLKAQYHNQFDQNIRLENLQSVNDSYFLSKFLISLFVNYAYAVSLRLNKNYDLGKDIYSKLLDLISPGLVTLIGSVNKVNNSKLNPMYLKIYYLMYLAVKEKTECSYLDFKKTLFENLDILPKLSIQTFHHCLLVSFVNGNHIRLNPHKEALEIYDSLIKCNLITGVRNDFIPIFVFYSYLLKCFFISDSAKAKAFSSRFINKLEPKQAEVAKIYLRSVVSFINKDFMDSLAQISLLELPYSVLKIPLKYQKAMCIYEIGEYEMFLNEMDSLKHFVKNNYFVNNVQIEKINRYFPL